MARLNIERQEMLEPERIKFAKQQIASLGFQITNEDATKIQFVFKGSTVTLFPYSGWHSGKTITDGRGIEKLIKQISNQ